VAAYTPPMTAEAILTARLVLPLLTVARLERVLAGDHAAVESEIGLWLPAWWREDMAWLMRVRLRQIGENPAAEPWLLRPIGLRDGPAEAIGLFNFHGPPDDRGFAEVGYEIRSEHRGRGYAREAVRGMFDWAAAHHGVRRFRAAIAPDNERSVNLVRKLGMTRVGAQWDESDGLELLWTVEDWPTSPPAGP